MRNDQREKGAKGWAHKPFEDGLCQGSAARARNWAAYCHAKPNSVDSWISTADSGASVQTADLSFAGSVDHHQVSKLNAQTNAHAANQPVHSTSAVAELWVS